MTRFFVKDGINAVFSSPDVVCMFDDDSSYRLLSDDEVAVLAAEYASNIENSLSGGGQVNPYSTDSLDDNHDVEGVVLLGIVEYE